MSDMRLTSSRSALFLVFVPLLLVIAIGCLLAAAVPVEIGSEGGKVTMESDLQILMGQGGGHIKWQVSGKAAKEMRAIIDHDKNSEVSVSEASFFTSNLDNDLTQSALVYHGAKLQSFSLLERNRGVTDNSEYLVGSVNDSGTMEIRFLLEATINTRDTDFSLNDDVLVTTLFDSLSTGSNTTNTYHFVGDVEIIHINTIVGMNSFSSFDTEYGSTYRLRGPLWEVYRYSVSYEGGSMDNKEDKAKFEEFNVIQSPLELFIIVVALGFFTLYIPKRHARAQRMIKVKPLHRGALGLVVLNTVIYLLGVDGFVLFITAPLFLVLIFALSYKIYIKRWKRIAKPLTEAERIELDRDDGIIRPQSYKKLMDDDSRRYPPERRPERGRPPPRRRPPRSPRGRRRPVDDQSDDYYDDPYDDDDHDDRYEDDRDDRRYDDEYEEDEYYDRRRRPPRRRPRGEPPRRTPERPPPRPEPKATPARKKLPPPGPPTTSEPSIEQTIKDLAPEEPDKPLVLRKKIRCAQCKDIFVAEIREHPTTVECPKCGKKGMIK